MLLKNSDLQCLTLRILLALCWQHPPKNSYGISMTFLCNVFEHKYDTEQSGSCKTFVLLPVFISKRHFCIGRYKMTGSFENINID